MSTVHTLTQERKKSETYPDSTAVHHGLVFRLYCTGVVEDHDYSLESLDGWRQTHWELDQERGNLPLGGVSDLPTRTIPLRTCVLRIRLRANLGSADKPA